MSTAVQAGLKLGFVCQQILCLLLQAATGHMVPGDGDAARIFAGALLTEHPSRALLPPLHPATAPLPGPTVIHLQEHSRRPGQRRAATDLSTAGQS